MEMIFSRSNNQKIKRARKIVEAARGALGGAEMKVSVTGEKMTGCSKKPFEPCTGHGRAKITLEIFIEANSVEIGAIQKAVAPDDKSHFAGYVRGWNIQWDDAMNEKYFAILDEIQVEIPDKAGTAGRATQKKNDFFFQ